MNLYIRQPDFITPRENFVLQKADGELLHGDHVSVAYPTEQSMRDNRGTVLLSIGSGVLEFKDVRIVLLDEGDKLPGEE